MVRPFRLLARYAVNIMQKELIQRRGWLGIVPCGTSHFHTVPKKMTKIHES